MKKLVLLLVSFLALATLTACGSSAPAGKITIGVPPLNGDFIAGFTNSSYDKMVRDMIWGYATYDYTDAGEFVLDKTVVKEEKVTENEDGSKTYSFTLNKDLKWSDDTPITAADYVFGALLYNSPQFKAAGGDNSGGRQLVGWEAYADGKEASFPGVQLVDEHTFSVTISADELPYFYETAIASAAPAPLHVYAPGAKIEPGTSTVVFGGETKDMAQAAKVVSEKERFAPSVTSGMYTFVKYEQEAVELKVNPNYKGDYRGHKPSIETVEVRRVNEELDVEYVINGDIDITTGVVQGEKINAAKEAEMGFTKYQRNGYGFISFHNDFGPVADQTVRQAFAYLVDRDVFVNQILEGYGVVVNGMYGLGQWMYQENAEGIKKELTNYVYNPETANELLDTTAYKFEKDGKTPFDASKAGKDYYRHNAEGQLLELNHAGSTNNPITELIASDVAGKLEGAGIKFNIDYLDFNAMLEFYYFPKKQEEQLGKRKYHTFNLASGFTAVFDPYSSLHSDYFGQWQNATQVKDAKFDELIMKLRRTSPEDRKGYSATWFEFQKHWNEYLPEVPLYSNEYYDIYSPKLKDVNTTPFYGIGRAIIDVKLK